MSEAPHETQPLGSTQEFCRRRKVSRCFSALDRRLYAAIATLEVDFNRAGLPPGGPFGP
jgi:hypothetical protein